MRPPTCMRMRARVFVLLTGLAGLGWAQAPPQRIPRQQVQHTASVALWVHSEANQGIPGARISLALPHLGGNRHYQADADGIVRIPELEPGQYVLTCDASGWQAYQSIAFTVGRGEIKTLAVTMMPAAGLVASPWRGVGPPPIPPAEFAGVYQELARVDAALLMAVAGPPPSDSDLYVRTPDRWEVEMPDWHRYNRKVEYPYVTGNWWDPFNRNKLKGDYPVLGQRTFFNFTGASNTVVDERRLPVASDVSTARPGTPDFFGRGVEFFTTQTFRFTGDLFHGDPSYRPVSL